MAKAEISPTKEFVIPVALLKTFQKDVRMRPVIDHSKGYITFDMEMLVSVLRSKDPAKAVELAKQLENLSKAGGELIILER